MSKRRKRRDMSEISVDPEQYIAAEFDSTGIRKSEVADPSRAGMRVLDDCAEEHKQ